MLPGLKATKLHDRAQGINQKFIVLSSLRSSSRRTMNFIIIVMRSAAIITSGMTETDILTTSKEMRFQSGHACLTKKRTSAVLFFR